MEWYFASDMNDLTVPKNEVVFDCLQSPDSWAPWGQIEGNLNSPKKIRASSVCQGSRHALSQQSVYTDEHADAELDDLARMDEADDVFFRSIFESDASEVLGVVDSSLNLTQTSRGERNHARDRRNNVDASLFIQSKEPKFVSYDSEEQFNMHEDVSDEDISMEESVLLELQRSSLQLAEKTRICFRDSLYRLAENSRHHHTSCSQNETEAPESCKPTAREGPSRLRESKAEESDRNAIDRTVANLLFDTMDFCNNDTSSQSGLTDETRQRAYYSHLYQPSPTPCTLTGGDAEVPTFGFSNIY